MRKVLVLLTVLLGSVNLATAKKIKLEVKYADGKIEKYEYDDSTCQMVGWQKKVGLSFSFDILSKYKGQGAFNFSNEKIRQLDDLQTDFGLQFEGLCKDYIIGRYKDYPELYDCRRGNVNNALSRLRQLKITLEAVKSIQDAAAQKDAVTAIIDKYFEVSANNFSKDCNPRALNLDRNELRFSKDDYEHSVGISNGGYFAIIWQALNTPHGFLCTPKANKIAPAGSDILVVSRLRAKPDTGSQVITVKDNFDESSDLKLLIDDGSDATDKLVSAIRKVLDSSPDTDVEAVTTREVRRHYLAASDTVVYWVSGELLTTIGKFGAAKNMLNKASQRSPELNTNPQFKLDLGIVLGNTGNRDQSFALFEDLMKSPDTFYAEQANIATRQLRDQSHTMENRAESTAADQQPSERRQIDLNPKGKDLDKASEKDKRGTFVPK